MDNIERVNSVYFELYSPNLGRKVINEPKGWNEDFLTLERDKDSKDIRKKIEVDLEFTGEGASYLANLYVGYGVAPNCLITKYEKSNTSIDEVYNLVYVQRIDLKTYKRDNDTGVVEVKAFEGGLFDFIKNRYDDEVDLLSNFSMDGDFIGELKVHPFMPMERKIILKTLLEGDRQRYRIGTGYWAEESSIWSGRPVPFQITYKSDATNDIQVPDLVREFHDEGKDRSAPADPVIGANVGRDLPFFFEAEEYKEFTLDVNIKLKITDFESRYARNYRDFHVRYVLSEKGDDGIQKLKDFEDIIVLDMNTEMGVEHDIRWSKKVTLEKGESLSLLYVTRVGIARENPFKNGYVNVFVNSDAKITLNDITEYIPEVSRVIKPIDLFDRLVAKITGKTGIVRSDSFGVGGGMEFHVLDNGFFARGFPDIYQDGDGDDKAIQLNTSFKEALESFSAITPMCWVIEKEGNKEVVRVEPDTYAQQNFIGVEIENVEEVRETCSDKDQFSKIELGHEGSLEYEEVNGLDEPNGKASFSTHLGRSVNNPYSKVSKYRFDSQGYELIRRISYDRFPMTDTDRDSDIWIHAAKETEVVETYQSASGKGDVTGKLITHRSWVDDFSSKPKGINFPETAWNLIFSPMNLLINGHGSAVRRCLYHDPNKLIRFSSSNANQNLVTYFDGEDRVESGRVAISKLKKQRVKADKVDMTLKVTPEIHKQLEGVNERGVRNVFGLVAYSEKGVKKYGRIIKLTSGENSKLQLIKAGV